MATERVVLCGGVVESNLPFGGEPLRFRMWGDEPNANLQIDAVSTALAASVPPALLDLLDIATYVYCADQATTRGGAGVDNVGQDWRRRFYFRVPVRVPDLWKSAKAQEVLTTTLGFLSDDEYAFEFEPLVDGPKLQAYLFGSTGRAPDAIEEVVLFSGGLDSLGGAIQEAVIDRRRIALVTHQPSSKLMKRYGKLKERLTAKAAHAPVFVPVEINKKKSLGKEYTQRSRSFLYMALGASVARVLGLSRLRFYENGVISFNFPPSAQVVGAKATRTTHPRVLRGFAEILGLVTGAPFAVENLFLWRTKADVVRGIVAAGCAEMIKFATSCTHTWEMTKIHPHCGACSQCVDRRFAVLAAGAEAWDPEEGYKAKLLTGAPAKEETRTLLASYVETAKDVSRMSPVQFFSRFGEASRVLRSIEGTADDAARKVYDLYRSHATGVVNVVRSAISAHASELLDRSLPPTCLLRLACDSSSSALEPGRTTTDVAAPPRALELPRHLFARKGREVWHVRFDGGSDFMLVRSRGAAYLHILLSNPNNSIAATKLAAIVAGQPEEYLLGSAGERTDREALADYEAQFQSLREDMDEARSQHDEARQEKIQAEMDQLIQAIEKDRGLGGRLRRASDARERIRSAVTNAITRVVKQIAHEDGAFARHLQPPILKCGLHPCYSPPQPVGWTLS